jgi:hypothetical protein
VTFFFQEEKRKRKKRSNIAFCSKKGNHKKYIKKELYMIDFYIHP